MKEKETGKVPEGKEIFVRLVMEQELNNLMDQIAKSIEQKLKLGLSSEQAQEIDLIFQAFYEGISFSNISTC